MNKISAMLSVIIFFLVASSTPAQQTGVVEIISPKAGQVYTVGDTMKIRWVMRGARLPVGIVPLISPDEGMIWLWTIDEFIRTGDIAFYTDSIGEYDWIVPDSLRWSGPGKPNVSVINEKCRININLPYDSDLGDYYSGEFSIRSSDTRIQPQWRAISSPAGSETSDRGILQVHHGSGMAKGFRLDGRCAIMQEHIPTGLYIKKPVR